MVADLVHRVEVLLVVVEEDLVQRVDVLSVEGLWYAGVLDLGGA